MREDPERQPQVARNGRRHPCCDQHVKWFAQQVAPGRIRWVVAGSTGAGLPGDSRTGSGEVMSAVAKTCKTVTTSSGTTIYDCQGSAAALAKLA